MKKTPAEIAAECVEVAARDRQQYAEAVKRKIIEAITAERQHCAPEKLELPMIMRRRITREEIIDALRNNYADTVTLARHKDPTFVGYPDLVTVLDFIEQFGLPPKGQP